MKFITTVLAVLTFQVLVLGQHIRCSTDEILSKTIKENPTLIDDIQDIENFTQNWISGHNQSTNKTAVVLTLPIVFHVIYTDTTENISDAQIFSQIDGLNEDYRKLNANFALTPDSFKPIAADAEIEFCLAAIDPDGNPTNGITRTPTTINNIGFTSSYYRDATGGKDAWDRTRYVNIWVCSIDGGFTLGFATPPGTAIPPIKDGLVIDPRYIGSIGSAQTSQPFNLGKTATHEIGHYLNLIHTWGQGGCSSDDMVADTPLQSSAKFGCNTFPQLDACTPTGNGVNYSNFMDYGDDTCMTMFTFGQKSRMLAALNGPRVGLLTSGACPNISITDRELNSRIKIFPNPAKDKLTIVNESTDELEVSIFNISGQLMASFTVVEQKTINTGSFAPGMYILHYSDTEKNSTAKKIVISQ